MKILLNTKPFVLSQKTGVGYYVLNLYRELLRSGIDVLPILDTKSRSLVTTLSRVSSGLRKRIGKWYPTFVAPIGDALISGLSQRRSGPAAFDMYHETSLDPMPELNTACVCNVYDLAFFRHPEFLKEEFVRFARANVTENVRAARRIIVNTESVKNEVMDILKISAGRIDVIPLAPSITQPRKGRQRSSLSKKISEKDYLLFVGSVEPRKNLKVLLKAFSLVRQRYDLSLVIAGTFGWRSDDIMSYSHEMGIQEDVLFTHYIDERMLPHLYSHASVFVYPSLYEGFGLPPLEAMTYGVPVIVSDIPPLREVSGDAAIAFNPADHEELAHAIEKILSSESLRSDMRQRGMKKAGEYSWGKVAAETILTYKRALEH